MNHDIISCRLKVAVAPNGMMHYVFDVPEDEGPLLDEVEFKTLCDNLIEAFTVPGFNEVGIAYTGCHTSILGPGDMWGFPVWSNGRYDKLSIREARMLASILAQRLDLQPPASWAEVVTSRFLVSSRDDHMRPNPYVTG
jgi:hypothetical protein